MSGGEVTPTGSVCAPLVPAPEWNRSRKPPVRSLAPFLRRELSLGAGFVHSSSQRLSAAWVLRRGEASGVGGGLAGAQELLSGPAQLSPGSGASCSAEAPSLVHSALKDGHRLLQTDDKCTSWPAGAFPCGSPSQPLSTCEVYAFF